LKFSLVKKILKLIKNDYWLHNPLMDFDEFVKMRWKQWGLLPEDYDLIMKKIG